MLDKQTLEAVLKDWNFWDKTPPPSIPRRVLESLPRLVPDLVFVIQGVRRSGKSTLLVQLMDRMSLNPLDCTFVNFEDPRLSSTLDFKLLDAVVSLSHERRPHGGPLYFFFDEIQNVDQWQKWFHRKMERPGTESFVITGSNASLLAGDLSTALTGRHVTVELFPFDWNEYRLVHPGGSIEDFMRQGGFPRVLTYENPETLLREYFTDIIERDVRRHVAARSTTALAQLAKAVFESAGSETSQRSLAGLLGVTADTAGSYLEACEAAYILLRCPYFTYSERQRTARNKKYYPVDLGLRNSVVTKTGGDKGKSLETLVFLHLRKKYKEVCYWRQEREVDLVVRDRSGITPYQVSWEGLKPRHEEALKEFYKTFPEAQSAVTITRENIEEFLS